MPRLGKPATIENLGKVNAVIDAQGYFLVTSRTFKIRELAITTRLGEGTLGSSYTKILDVDPDIQNGDEYNARNIKVIRYAQERIHGLPLANLNHADGYILQGKVAENLRSMSLFFTNKFFPYLACKNHFLAVILDKCSIPFVNLESENFDEKRDGFADLYGSEFACKRHIIPVSGKKVCAARKSRLLMRYIEKLIHDDDEYEIRREINDIIHKESSPLTEPEQETSRNESQKENSNDSHNYQVDIEEVPPLDSSPCVFLRPKDPRRKR